MTDTEHETTPVLVQIVGTDTTEEHAPDLSSFQNFFLTISGGAIRIAGNTPKRKQLILNINTITEGSNLDRLHLGSREQVQNGQGFICEPVAGPFQIILFGRSEIWAMLYNEDQLITSTALISTIDERYL